jgi:hypothetical protein
MKHNGFMAERKMVDGVRSRWVSIQLNKPALDPGLPDRSANNVLDFHKKAS